MDDPVDYSKEEEEEDVDEGQHYYQRGQACVDCGDEKVCSGKKKSDARKYGLL